MNSENYVYYENDKFIRTSDSHEIYKVFDNLESAISYVKRNKEGNNWKKFENEKTSYCPLSYFRVKDITEKHNDIIFRRHIEEHWYIFCKVLLSEDEPR